MYNPKPFRGTHATQQRMQKQWDNTSHRWHQQQVNQQMQQIRAGQAYQLAAGVGQRRGLVQRGVEGPSSWKKIIGAIILIAVPVLLLAAALGEHSSSAALAGTPGVINVGANIRTGPGTQNSIAATAPAGTRIVISCRVATPAGRWDKLSSPYRGLFVSATLVNSRRPSRC